MTRSGRPIPVVCLLALVMLAAMVRAQQTPAPPPPAPLVDATNLIMQPEAAANGGRVMGDTSKPGIYVQRVRWAPGRGSRPHYHNQDRYVTVIKGTWWAAFGAVYKPADMVPIREGGFIFHPAGKPHYDTARDEEVIVEIVGLGPVETTPAEVDEKGQPVSGRGGRGGAPAPGAR
jgi:quercetin dioxygenase-like cupin family protein